jgi:hypothetical protein
VTVVTPEAFVGPDVVKIVFAPPEPATVTFWSGWPFVPRIVTVIGIPVLPSAGAVAPLVTTAVDFVASIDEVGGGVGEPDTNPPPL